MRTAVIGMGQMGRAIAGRLLAGGHRVTLWNRSPGRTGELEAAGAEAAGSVAEAVREAEVILTMLSDDRAVREVALGETGVVRHLARGACYTDCSTVSPALSEELAEAVPRFAALPVLGNPDAVASGSATYLLGASPEAASVLEGILPALSAQVRRFERAGLATTAKLTSNLLLLAGVVALAEAMATGRAGGLSDEELRGLLEGSPMVAPGLGNRFRSVLGGGSPGWWTTRLGGKDARLAVELAVGGGAALPVAEAVAEVFRRAGEAGLGDEDIAAVARLYQS